MNSLDIWIEIAGVIAALMTALSGLLLAWVALKAVSNQKSETPLLIINQLRSQFFTVISMVFGHFRVALRVGRHDVIQFNLFLQGVTKVELIDNQLRKQNYQRVAQFWMPDTEFGRSAK